MINVGLRRIGSLDLEASQRFLVLGIDGERIVDGGGTERFFSRGGLA